MTQISRTSILQDALRHLEEAPLLNGQVDQRPVTRMLNDAYPIALGSMLRKALWAFATKRDILSPTAAAPISGWLRAYPVPSDFVHLYPLTEDGTVEGRIIPHRIEGRSIVTNGSGPLTVAYVAQVDEAYFTPDFAEALALNLAARMASAVTGKANLKGVIGQAYATALKECIEANAGEDRQRSTNPIVMLAYRHIMSGKDAGASTGDSILYDLRLAYDDTLQEALELHPWNFATVRRVLVADDTRPAFGFRWRYAKPDDLLRISQPTVDGVWQAANVTYRIEGDWIVSNVGPSLMVLYVQAGTPVAKMPAAFRKYVAARLALSVVTGTSKAALINGLSALSAQSLTDARMNDSVQGSLENPQQDYWEKARFAGSDDGYGGGLGYDGFFAGDESYN